MSPCRGLEQRVESILHFRGFTIDFNLGRSATGYHENCHEGKSYNTFHNERS